MEIVLAIVIGAAFGAVLDRVGATNPGLIIKMLNLTDLHLMRTILLGIGSASVLLFGGLMLGLVDPGHLSVKDTYAGVFVGGIFLGIGFAVAGYCPGTGLTAAATGRWDAWFFVLGGLLGAGAYMLVYRYFEGSALLAKLAGGKATLGVIEGTDYPALFGVSGEWLGLALGVLLMVIAALLPGRFMRRPAAVPAE